MRTPVAFIGYSKSGKTTLLVSLVGLLAGQGERVAVIKHTHHEPARRKPHGDTERFLEAGAVSVVLAGQGDAVIQYPDGTAEARRFESAADIPGWLDADRILVEGFKDLDLWPRILVEREKGETIRPLPGVSAVVTDSTESFHLPRFRHDDLDGTLVDSYDALQQSVNHTRSRFDLGPLALPDIKAMVGDGLGVLLERTFRPGPVPPEAKSIFEEHYDIVCCGASRLLDGVDTTIERLYSAGTRMAICTNKPTPFSVKIVEHLGLIRFMRAVVGPDTAGARKPEAQHVRVTIDRAGGRLETTLFVGDMQIDVEAARNAGVSVAVIPTGAVGADALRAANADFLLERFDELERIVLEDEG